MDDYVTMLYNDEVHSYDQVTSTLRKVLVIDDKKAFEYAAIVDKEGRSAIKRGKRLECETVKNKVEQIMSGPITNALDTKVMHHSLVAHQYFAEKLIVWMQKTVERSSSSSSFSSAFTYWVKRRSFFVFVFVLFFFRNKYRNNDYIILHINMHGYDQIRDSAGSFFFLI